MVETRESAGVAGHFVAYQVRLRRTAARDAANRALRRIVQPELHLPYLRQTRGKNGALAFANRVPTRSDFGVRCRWWAVPWKWRRAARRARRALEALSRKSGDNGPAVLDY